MCWNKVIHANSNKYVSSKEERRKRKSLPLSPPHLHYPEHFFGSFESPDFGWLRVGYSLWGSDILGFRFNIHPLQSLNISVSQSPPPWNEGDDNGVCLIRLFKDSVNPCTFRTTPGMWRTLSGTDYHYFLSWFFWSFSSVQLSRSVVSDSLWPHESQHTRPPSLSITNSQSSLRLTSIESVMPSSHLILCRPLLLLPPIPPSIRVFSNESTLRMAKVLAFQL